MDQILILAKAYNFAAKAHANQRRKGKAKEPYINHITEVAELVSSATNGENIELIAAAILHDTVEDTYVQPSDIKSIFGDKIASIVNEVTDDKSLPKQKRKSLQINSVSSKSIEARLLKIADKTSNLRSLISSPPNWTNARKLKYLKWARDVIAGARGLNQALEDEFDTAAKQLEDALMPFEVFSYDCWKMHTDEDCYGSEGKFATFEEARDFCAQQIDQQIASAIELSQIRPLTGQEIKDAVSELSSFGWSYSISGKTPEAKAIAKTFFFLNYARERLSQNERGNDLS